MVNRLKLNEKTVREAPNLGRDYQIFDTDVRGFSITIYPSGNRAFALDYRIAGRQRRMTIGRWPEWNTGAARERAKELRRDIDEGIDPLNLRETSRESVMSLQGENTARGIVDLVRSGKLNEASTYGRLHDEISGLLRDNPDARAHVHDLLRDGPITKEMALLAHSLAQNPTPEDVVLLVKCEVATQRSFLGWRSIEAAVTNHVPSETWRGAFDVMPIPSTWLRRELLALTGDGGKNDPAARCLTEIDKIRDRYGAPDAEPRHPHLASGRPWPILTPDPYAEDGG